MAGQPPRLVSVKDDTDQAGYVVEQLLARREDGIRLKSQAVLFRASHHSARLELELTRRNIPFVKFGGLKFLEAAHVKDMLATLRWSQNLKDRVSGFRAIQLLAGIGPRTAGRVLDNLVSAPPGCALLAEQPVPEGVKANWLAFAALVESLATAPWPAAFEQLSVWYQDQMERLFDDALIRQADIEQLARIAATFPSLERFLTELTLNPPEATSDESGVPLLDEDYLILSTIHSAKGQEWNAVTLLNAVDGCLPSDLATGSAAEIEEERRLLYVAMTRARDHLDIMLPQRFYVSQQMGGGDRHVYASRSRFIPNALLPHFDQVSWPPPPPEMQGSPASRQSAVDLAARMRAMWG
jgi:DNA helicase-2/ATP-dependent DNA helicase PcrA